MATVGPPTYNVDIGAMLRDAVNDAGRAASGTARELADLLARDRVGNEIKKQFWGAHAEAVLSAVSASYKSTLAARRSGPPGYRKDDKPPHNRFADGALAKALASPKNVSVTARGLRLFNQGHLDQKAKQWYRLNYGTSPYSPGKVAYTVRIGSGVSLGPLVLPGEASGPMYIPRGYFRKDGAFFVNRKNRHGPFYLTKGVRPRGFLDHGLETFAKNLSSNSELGILQLHRKLFAAGLAQIRTPRGAQLLTSTHRVTIRVESR